MTPVQRVLATARSENGYLEKATNAQLEDKTANAGYNNWNKFAAFLDDLEVVYNGKKNGYAWCDCFVDYCFIYTFGLELGMAMTFQPKKGAGAGCTYSMGYYKKAGRFFKEPAAWRPDFLHERRRRKLVPYRSRGEGRRRRVYTIEATLKRAWRRPERRRSA